MIAPNSVPICIADRDYTDVNGATAANPHNEGCESASQGVMDRIMAFKDNGADQTALTGGDIKTLLDEL